MNSALTSALEDVDLVAHDGDESNQSVFTIGDLAREFDVTLRTLRFYEDKALLNPRRDGLNRIYSRRDRARLKLVLMGKRVGFSLYEIKEMLDLYDLKDGQTLQLEVALDKFKAQISVLETQRREVDAAITELTRTVDIVEKLLAARGGK
ncbi:MAG: MerR family DNA-binding transcriptional regulator [Hyphomicrobiaceae bacterium]|nr:MerR family DNA-binding transcriptional regulator [Hyphomicrobiaceae bacterium]